MYREQQTKLFVRDVGQEGVIKQQKEYNKLKKLGAKIPRALDLGGHIGSFAWFAKNFLDVQKILSVEPDPANIEVFRRNWKHDSSVTLLEGAVSDTQKEANLYLGKKYSSCNSLTHFRGREAVAVKCYPLRKLLSQIKPVLIKCDIEGGEYSIDWSNLPDYVKLLCFEFHYQKPEWLDEQIKIDKMLLRQKFKHIKPPANKVTFQKVSIAIYQR